MLLELILVLSVLAGVLGLVDACIKVSEAFQSEDIDEGFSRAAQSIIFLALPALLMLFCDPLTHEVLSSLVSSVSSEAEAIRHIQSDLVFIKAQRLERSVVASGASDRISSGIGISETIPEFNAVRAMTIETQGIVERHDGALRVQAQQIDALRGEIDELTLFGT